MSTTVINNYTSILYALTLVVSKWGTDKRTVYIVDNFNARFVFGFPCAFSLTKSVSASLSSPLIISLRSITLTMALFNCSYSSCSAGKNVFRYFALCCRLMSTSRDLINTLIAFEAGHRCVRRAVRRIVRWTQRRTTDASTDSPVDSPPV
jgi:hypothetical protein